MYYYRMKSIATYEPSQCFTIVAQHDFLIFNNSTPNEKERKSNCMISYDDDYHHNSTIRSTHGPPNLMGEEKEEKKNKDYIHTYTYEATRQAATLKSIRQVTLEYVCIYIEYSTV